MGKVKVKKEMKKAALMKSAYDLFTTEGFTGTTIRDIADRAGVAKGTFYLYFRDKVEIREAVIRSTSSQLLREACASLDARMDADGGKMNVADIFIYIIDYLIERVEKDPLLLQFMAKHLSWGLFYSGDPKGNYDGEAVDADALDIERYVLSKLDEYDVRIGNLKFLIFTLLELVSSTCHDVILYGEPARLEEFKPYLNNCIRLLVSDAVIDE